MTQASDSPADLIDRDHLDRQTMGDKQLATEVLGMFLFQVDKACRDLRDFDADRRPGIAHSLKGTARSVGAFQIGDCAAAIECAPGDATHLDLLDALATQLRAELAASARPAG